MSRHSIDIPVGSPVSVGLAELRQTLAWYAKHPKIAATPRGQRNIARLQRQIEDTEQQSSKPSTY